MTGDQSPLVLERGSPPKDAIRHFFDSLPARGTLPVLQDAQGIVQVQITDAGVWRLQVEHGAITLLEAEGPADGTLSCSARDFLRILKGETNAYTAFLRGDITMQGDWALVGRIRLLIRGQARGGAGHAVSVPVRTGGRRATKIKTGAQVKEQPAQKTQDTQPPAKTVNMLDGNTFVVSDTRGDIDATPTDMQGLFAADTRYLSKWVLTIDGLRPNILSIDDLQYCSAKFFLVPGTGTVYVDATLSIIRERVVGGGFHEELTILNHNEQSSPLTVRMEAGADFADLFEVKDALPKQGRYYQRVTDGRLVLGYERERYVRETWITASAPEARLDEHGVTFQIQLAPHSTWKTSLDVVAARTAGNRVNVSVKYAHCDDQPRPEMQRSLYDWLAAAPRLVSDNDALARIYKRSLVDLAALRYYPHLLPRETLPAAGLPWFMAIFGRDSLITSFQALPFAPDLAEATLRQLTLLQGTSVDDFRDEEPGKILHELRFGEMTAFEERPHSPYYGSADATQLFLIVLDEYERWTGNTQLVRELEPAARAAMRWIDDYGDRNGDGYIDYDRRNKVTGLENQCWKDSWNSILFADGTLSKLPRATCELQGYAYDAKMRCARLARVVWNDTKLADRLEREAADLKRRFNHDFWLADRRYFALAIDGDGRKVDALTSNIGHLLWSGIADEDKAEACVHHLMSERLFTGWGVRTMAEGDGGYNPVGYHVGTVWPFDNSLIAMGLTRYGYRTEAARIATGILEAAPYFHNRLPEAFAGYARSLTRFPVEYPTASSPQAWSTGAPLLLLRAVLGLDPIDGKLLVDPALSTQLGRIELLDIPGRWGKVDAFGRGRIDLKT